MPPIAGAFAFALIAAIGNAIFTYGNRSSRETSGESPFGFVLMTLLIAAIAIAGVMAFNPPKDAVAFSKANMVPALWAGIGTAVTYVGFYYLYSRYGASYYVLYGMLALVTTAIGIGVVVFREKFNLHYGLAILCAVGALTFFMLGQRKPG